MSRAEWSTCSGALAANSQGTRAADLWDPFLFIPRCGVVIVPFDRQTAHTYAEEQRKLAKPSTVFRWMTSSTGDLTGVEQTDATATPRENG